MQEKWRRVHPAEASGASVEIVSGAAQFRFRTPQAVLVSSRFGSASGLQIRLDRFDSLLGSI
eukprot:9128039-Alexandrium_andersonii.AAC.1